MGTETPPERSRRWPALLLIAAVAGVCAWWSTRPSPPAPVAQMEAAAPAAPAEPKPAPPEVVTATDSPPHPLLNVGFCPSDGDDVSVTIKHTLQGLVNAEAARRFNALPPESQAQVRQAAADIPAHGLSLTGDTAVTALLFAARERIAPVHVLAAANVMDAEDPYVHVVRALEASALGRSSTKLDEVRAARRKLPDDPALGWNLYAALRDTPELDEALAGIDAYLRVDPAPAIARMRALLEVQRDIQRPYLRRENAGVTLLWPSGALSDTQVDALLNAVPAALDDAARFTGTERRSRLTVVVYPGQAELLAVACVRTWAAALYDGTLRLVAAPDQPLGVPAQQLRHESLHAQLSPAVPQAPKWFHEGVAQSFAEETPRARGAWTLLVRNRSWIPFSSLDGSFQVFEQGNDANLAYAESLALVEYLRDAGGQGAIAEALRAFREGADTSTALARASHRSEVTGADLMAFLAGRLNRDQ